MTDWGEFGVEKTVETDGRIRLRLTGELDQAVTDALSHHLDELKRSGAVVRLDLSNLDFIDSSGIRCLLLNVRDARRDHWELEVDRDVSWQVERVIKVLGIAPVFWPEVKESD